MGKSEKLPKVASTKGDKAAKGGKFPKQVCCESSTKCGRCPLRMLKEGTLPHGYTVKRRRLVKLESVELMHQTAPVVVSTKVATVEALACHTTKKKIKKSRSAVTADLGPKKKKKAKKLAKAA